MEQDEKLAYDLQKYYFFKIAIFFFYSQIYSEMENGGKNGKLEESYMNDPEMEKIIQESLKHK